MIWMHGRHVSTLEILCWMFVQLEAWLQDRKKRRQEKQATAAALNEWFQTAKGKHYLAQKRSVGGKFRLDQSPIYLWKSGKFRGIVTARFDLKIEMRWGPGPQKNHRCLLETLFLN